MMFALYGVSPSPSQAADISSWGRLVIALGALLVCAVAAIVLLAAILGLACWASPVQVPRLTVHDATAGFRTFPVFAGWEMHEVRLDGKCIGHLRYSPEAEAVDFEYGPGLTVLLDEWVKPAEGPDGRTLSVVHRPVSGWFVDVESHTLVAGGRARGTLTLRLQGEPSLQFKPHGLRPVDLHPLLRVIP